jgi:tRNA-modifying protein YgfZ
MPAILAAKSTIALFDLKDWGLIELTGADRLRFLHNQSTANISALKPGQGCETVFVTATARTIELVTVYAMAESLWLLVPPGQSDRLMGLMDRVIFFNDKVELKDIRAGWTILSLIGPEAEARLGALGVTGLDELVNHGHCEATIAGEAVRLAVGCGLGLPGYCLFVAGDGAAVRSALAGVAELDAIEWEQLRVEQGRPIAGAELTEDYNPLEAGLWQTIVFDKGCYIGQETIARLNTYNGVKQRLWGLRLSGVVEVGAVLMVGEEKVGKVTTVVASEAGVMGLAYVRTKAGGAGLKVMIGAVEAEVVALDYVSHPIKES